MVQAKKFIVEKLVCTIQKLFYFYLDFYVLHPGLGAVDDIFLKLCGIARIKRCAAENNVTIFTSLDTVRVLLDVLEETTITVSTIDS